MTNKWLSIGITPPHIQANIEAGRISSAVAAIKSTRSKQPIMVADVKLPLWITRLYQIEDAKLEEFTAAVLGKHFNEARSVMTNFFANVTKQLPGLFVMLGTDIPDGGGSINVYKLHPNWRRLVRTYITEHYSPPERAAKLLQLII